jgi:hypothetical protein
VALGQAPMARKTTGRGVLILSGFKEAASCSSMLDGWWCDITLLKLLKERYGCHDVLHKDTSTALGELNGTISKTVEFRIIDAPFPVNKSGMYRWKMNVFSDELSKSSYRFFYYFSSDKTKPPTLLTAALAQKRQGLTIRFSERSNSTSNKRQRSGSFDFVVSNRNVLPEEQEEQVPLPADIAEEEVILRLESQTTTTITTSTNNPLLIDPPDFWSSVNARKIFGVADGDNPKEILQVKMDICKSKAAENIGSEISLKYLLLRVAYETALSNMPTLTWVSCCSLAIKKMESAGIDSISNPRTICKWNVYFRENNYLEIDPNNKIPKPYEPSLFACYPESKETIKKKFSGSKLEVLSVFAFRDYILDELIPSIVEEENDNLENEGEEHRTTKEIVLQSFGLKTLCLSTTHRYLTYLGYKWSDQKKCYYNDGHERKENVLYRKDFIKKYFSKEIDQYLWISLMESEAIQLEDTSSSDDNVRLLKSIYYSFEEHGIPMREYHVDSHPTFAAKIADEYNTFGGNLSRRKCIDKRPLIVVGQDESAFSQFSFSSKSWQGPDGQSQLLPKSAGDTIMVSAFQSRVFGLGRLLTEEEILKINRFRSNQRSKYLSEEAAINVVGDITKKPITDNSAFMKFFEIGLEKDGYWNYQQMAIQTEDVVDCLQGLYPEHDFCLLFDQSSGHSKKRSDGLNVVGMNLNWGGSQRTMRETVLEDQGCLGQFESRYNVGDTQQLNFAENDEGPFYLSDAVRERRKQNMTGRRKRKEKTKNELLREIITTTNFNVIKHYNKDEIKELANGFGIEIFHEVDDVIEGWVGKPKGVLQILYERGYIDPNRDLKEYSLDGKEEWKDDDGEIRQRYLPFCLRYILSQCSDFKNEITAMEDLALRLSINDSDVSIMFTPKYHCEIAGEGIEYSWGLAKKYYRNLQLSQKKGVANFRISVKSCVSRVTNLSARRFCGLIRRYMLAYSHYDNPDNQQTGASYTQIERFVKKESKSHRNVSDNDLGNVKKVWLESLNLPSETI